MIVAPKEKCFHSINVKGKGSHSAEKTAQPEAKITTTFRLL